MRAEIVDAAVTFAEQPFRTPLVLRTGPIARATEAQAEVTVQVAGRQATGHGSILLGVLWSWPEGRLSHERREGLLRGLCEDIARGLADLCGGRPAHPLELGLRLHENVCTGAADAPPLARAMCASPFDAAIHDAVGIATERSAFALYDAGARIPAADGYFPGEGACSAVRAMLRPPRRVLRAWLVVGKDQALSDDLPAWVCGRGYRCFKVKVSGADPVADAARTVEVFRAASALGADRPELSVDSNEGNPDADSVLEYLRRLRDADAEAFAALGYLEQPTARDIAAAAFDWREVAAVKCVLLDEGLTGLEVMEPAARQGWSGFALKTCKGHSFALAAAAWAHRRGMVLSLQDLTNPGPALIHAALLAAHLPTINDVELNSPQYAPAANRAFLPRLSALFDPTDGFHRLPEQIPPGLGSRL